MTIIYRNERENTHSARIDTVSVGHGADQHSQKGIDDDIRNGRELARRQSSATGGRTNREGRAGVRAHTHTGRTRPDRSTTHFSSAGGVGQKGKKTTGWPMTSTYTHVLGFHHQAGRIYNNSEMDLSISNGQEVFARHI